MKFLAIALLFLAVEAKKVLRVENLDAISRKLEGYNSISAENSIQFNKCVSLTTEPADNDVFYSEENLAYVQRGAIVSAKSYVMFNVCQTDYCEEGGSDNLYMVDLSTYLSSTMGYFPNRRKYYCQACEYSQKYCQKRNDWNEQQKQGYFNYQKQQEYQWAQQDQENYEDQDQGAEEEQNAQQYNQAQNYYQDQAAQQQYNQGQYQGGQMAEQYAAVESEQDGSYSSWMQAGKNWAMEQWYGVKNWWEGGRRLQNYGYYNYNYNKQPQNVETVTCSTCEQYGCFDEDYYERSNDYNYYNNGNSNAYYNAYQYNENQQQQQQQEEEEEDIDEEEVYEWVTQMSECMQIEGQDDIYAGFICNNDGSGIEIGVFLDEDCTIYNGMISYKSLILGDGNGGYNQAQQYQAQQQGGGYNYYWNNGQQQGGGNNYYWNNGQQENMESDDIAFLKATNEIVTYPFTHDINCADQMTYATPWGSYKQSGYYYNNQNGASQYCRALFQGNSVMMQDCDEDVRDNYQYQQSQYQYYAQEENEYGNYEGFYSYDLSQNELYNQVTVCQKIKSYNGKYPHIYYGQSNVFDYGGEDSGLSNVKHMWSDKDRFMERMFESVFEGENKGLKIFGFLAGSILIACLCLCMLKDCCWYNCCDCDEHNYHDEGQEKQPMATKLVPEVSGSESESVMTGIEDETVNGEVNVVSHYGVVSEIDDFYTRVDD